MSEFKIVHRNMVRMCDAMRAEDNGCAPCPLDGICAKFITLSEDAIATIERVVTQWAAEHPEPVYPKWKDGWKQLFPEADIERVFCPEIFGDKYNCDWCQGRSYDDNYSCDMCLERPMPAEIAEKLGIKQIAPENPPKHDCDTCKFGICKITDEPCARCKHSCIDCEESIITAPDLWEAAK